MHQGINHVCYKVEDLPAAVAAMAAAGVRTGHVTGIPLEGLSA